MVRGTPSAVVVVALPKVERLSERTMPESSRTSTPFDPSPGYGPLVSSGTTVRSPDEPEDDGPDDEPVDPEPEAVVVPPLDVDEPVVPAHPATRAPVPRAPNRPGADRRDTSVWRSYTRPRSSSSITRPRLSTQRSGVLRPCALRYPQHILYKWTCRSTVTPWTRRSARPAPTT